MATAILDHPGQPGLSAGTPLLLLPVRVETRFMPGVDTPELWLRVYPDQIAVDAHQPGLTQAEIDAGTAYWDAVWRAGKPPGDLEAVKGSWRTLARSFSPQRAAWIARQLTPQNAGQQPQAPVPAGTAPEPAPQYPPLPPRTTKDERPPLAAALPDRWTVVTYSRSGVRTHSSAPVREPLPVGLTPGGAPFPADLPVDAGMRWLVDFAEAERAGMALRIPLTAVEADPKVGLDRVIVYGLRTGGFKVPGEDDLTALLDAHHYTDGLAFVPQGQPTNNTPDASSAFSRIDPDYETSFAVERQDPLTGDPRTDGPVTARLLGLPAAAFDHVQHADGLDQEDARQAAVALWPATLGYFLRQVMADVFTLDQIAAARQWFCANVRPRGQLAAFRAGSVPYGVLPVTSLRLWAPPPRDGGPELAAVPVDAVEAGLVDFIRRALPVWRDSAASTPRVGGTTDPDQDLVRILGMDASSMVYRARHVLGDGLLWLVFPWLGFGDDVRQRWWDEHLRRGRELLDGLGYPGWDPRVIRMGMAPSSFHVTNPTVTPAPLSESDPLPADAQLPDGSTGNYLRWLRLASVDDVRAGRYPSTGPPPDALLYHILRQSLLLEYASQAADAEVRAGRLSTAQLHEAELVNVSPRVATLSPWQMLARPSLDRPTMTWAAYLQTFRFPPGSPYGSLEELRTSLDWLAGRPTAELDRLLTETLDACSHRLDCWATGLAASLLERHRSSEQPAGVHLGGFGWVDDLRPAPRPPQVTGVELDAARRLDLLRQRKTELVRQLSPPLQPHQDNGGFIYAPSPAQATTGAVLRNGYLTHRQTSNGALLAIDLSSTRTRTALWIMDAVRQGQPLGAVLGYRFERGLHELDRDLYVQPFRDRFPLVADKLLPSAPGEAVAASNVVDGLRLQRAWAQGALDWGGGLPAPGSADQQLVIGLLRDLDEVTDALSDLAVAEGVHQVTLGNYGRAGSALDAMSRGERPPDPQVVATVRGGLDLTHRVLVLLAGGQAAAPGWDAVSTHARAATEPRLDTWLGQQLPDPRRVRCHVTYQTAAPAAGRVPVSLADLDIGPLDLLAMSATTDQAQAGELEQRVLLAAALPPNATDLAVDFAPDPGVVSFPDTLVQARALRELVGAARPLEPKDLLDLERRPEDVGGAVDVNELRTRLNGALGRLDSAITALGTASTAAELRAALLAAAELGISGALPSPPDQDLAGLTARAQATLTVLQQRRAAIGTPPAAATAAQALELIQAIFGGTLQALPLFTPPDLPGLTQAFGDSPALTAGDDQAVFRWIQQLTHVRPGISRLDTAETLRQLLVDSAPPAFTLAQLPHQANDTWLGLTLPADGITQGRVSLVARIAGSLAQPPFAGLLVDEWPERIPSAAVTAGLAFHYEEPRARAPQSLLLAVCPDTRPVWDDELVRAILEDTLDLLRVRTVDLDSIQQVGQVLPALYFPFNLHGDTISLRPGFARFQQGVSR